MEVVVMRFISFLCLTSLIFFPESGVFASTVTEDVVQMVTNPYLIPFILTIGLIGIVVEFLFPGLIVPGTIGIAAFAIYFLGYYLAGSISWSAPALFALGLLLLILEVLIPNLGILGILGCLFLVASFMMTISSWQVGVISLAVAIVLTVLFIWVLSRYVNINTIWRRFILNDTQQNNQGYVSQKDRSYLEGKMGITITPLQSSGYARFGEDVEDVVSDGRSIPRNASVKVIAVEGTRVVVRQIEK